MLVADLLLHDSLPRCPLTDLSSLVEEMAGLEVESGLNEFALDVDVDTTSGLLASRRQFQARSLKIALWRHTPEIA